MTSQASEPAPEASGPAPSRARAVEIISTALADFMQRTTLVHGVDPRELLDPASGLEEESTWLALPGPMEGNARPGHSRQLPRSRVNTILTTDSARRYSIDGRCRSKSTQRPGPFGPQPSSALAEIVEGLRDHCAH